MPCTLSEDEIRYEEERKNERELGVAITDERAAIEAACQACRLLDKHGLLFQTAWDKDAKPSKFLLAWWKRHQEWDKKHGR